MGSSKNISQNMSYLNLHIKKQIQQKLKEADEILNQYQILCEGNLSEKNFKKSIKKLCDTISHEVVSSVGSEEPCSANTLTNHKATSVSFMNLPAPSAKATSSVETRSRRKVPKASGKSEASASQTSIDSEKKLQQRAKSVTKALESLITLAEQSKDSNSDSNENREEFERMSDNITEPSSTADSYRKSIRDPQNLRISKSKIISKISNMIKLIVNWLSENRIFGKFVSSIAFDIFVFIIVITLILYFVPCNRIPGF